MTKSRLMLIGAGVLVLAFVAVWLIAGSGKAEAERQAAENYMLLQIQTGAARVLEARVALYNVNFGDASRNFERAKPMFQQARDRLNATNRQADAGVLDRVIGLINDAQRMAGALDQGANTKAAEALEALRQISLPLDASPPAAQ
jgi:hypothetical protein